MKIAAGWFRERRGFALGILIGALTLGKAFPHLLTALYGDVVARADAAGVRPRGRRRRAGRWSSCATARSSPRRRRSIRTRSAASCAIRGARLATLGYLGHMWELYAMWTWIARAGDGQLRRVGCRDADGAGSLAAFLAIGSGTAGCALAGWLADRLGPRARRHLGDVDERRVRRADRRRLRRLAGLVLRARRWSGASPSSPTRRSSRRSSASTRRPITSARR